jgi:hypothetical protein
MNLATEQSLRSLALEQLWAAEHLSLWLRLMIEAIAASLAGAAINRIRC